MGSAAHYEEAKSELPVFIASRATAAAIDEQEDVGTLAVTLKEHEQLKGAPTQATISAVG